ncbi:MAG: hypothetical protein HC838_14660 [Spirulinaceae cyanobacterium RM2_2_10]|nr:hypothetical protein [Spirulinaceae cyanobacterium SM2_1_0]NJO21022.1 hypothetical protein [Spirulinaceae cyanobacterium RM2_2_10]
MASSAIDNLGDAFPRELVEFSAKVEATRDRHSLGHTTTPRYRFFEGEYYGAQLASLKARDWQALEVLFSTEDIEVVYLDIAGALHFLWPEPCWEDDPFDPNGADTFDFLAEYL